MTGVSLSSLLWTLVRRCEWDGIRGCLKKLGVGVGVDVDVTVECIWRISNDHVSDRGCLYEIDKLIVFYSNVYWNVKSRG